MFTIPDNELRQWLAEDVPYGDLTTHALGIGNSHGRITFEARPAMVAACSEEGGRIMALAGAEVIECVPSGTALQTGGLLLAAQGPAATLGHVVNRSAASGCRDCPAPPSRWSGTRPGSGPRPRSRSCRSRSGCRCH